MIHAQFACLHGVFPHAGDVIPVTDFCVVAVIRRRAADTYSLVAAVEPVWNAAVFPDSWLRGSKVEYRLAESI